VRKVRATKSTALLNGKALQQNACVSATGTDSATENKLPRSEALALLLLGKGEKVR